MNIQMGTVECACKEGHQFRIGMNRSGGVYYNSSEEWFECSTCLEDDQHNPVELSIDFDSTFRDEEINTA